MQVPIEVSARHIHISQHDLELLFGKGYTLTKHIKELSQPGQFAEEETVTVSGSKRSFEKVRILGPVREYTQVELSRTDCYFLGIEAPLRTSGNIKKSGSCVLTGPHGEITLSEGVIVARRHLHIHTDDANKLQVKTGDIAQLKIVSERSLTFDDLVVRVSDTFQTAIHLDTDEGNAAAVKTGDTGELLIKK